MNIFDTLKLPKNLLEYANSGKRIVLDNPDTLYLLKNGDMNLFITQFDEKNNESYKVYYSSLSKSSCFIIRGIASNNTSKLKLCAIAHLETEYVELPYREFDKLLQYDKELIQEQLNLFMSHLIKTAAKHVEIDTNNLNSLFTQNSDALSALFEAFILEKKNDCTLQYKRIKEESEQSYKKASSNLFQILETRNNFVFDKNSNALTSSLHLLGKIQKIDFITSNVSPEQNEDVQLDLICKQSFLRKRNISLELDWQNQCGIPFLGKLKSGKIVAVFPVEGAENIWFWYDSETNEINKVDDDFVDNIARKGVIFYKPLPNKPLTLKPLLGIMWDLSHLDLKRTLFLFFIASLLSSSIPVINSIIFSTVIPLADYRLLMQILILSLSFALTKGIIEYLNSLLILRIRTRINWALQAGIWDRILALPLSFFKNYSIGDLASRSLGISSLVEAYSNTFLKNILTWVFSFPALLLMFYYSPIYSIIMLFFIMLMICCFVICGIVSYKLQKKIADISGEIQGNIVEYFAGINKIRASKTENQTLEHWSIAFSKKKELYYKLSHCTKIMTILNNALPIFSITVIIGITLLVFSFAPKNAISVPDFIAFSASLSIVTASFGLMLTSFSEAIETIPIYQRLKPILEAEGEIHFSQKQVGTISGSIHIEHVTFMYDPLQRPILDNISLQIKSGEYLAIVGESGSGKSTLLRLLLGFEKPLQGSISYDNLDLSQVDLRQLRSQIGVVLQDGKLLSDSIYKNIVSGSASLTIDDAWDAARKAGCAEEIEAMPMQMHTVLNGDSGGISGGQKQRILIVRALARKPKLIFFDEATSALDNKVQSMVSETIAQLNITKIIIAHRLSSIIDADRIVVLSKGRIVEQGSYDELMQLNGFFAKQAKRQLIESDIESDIKSDDEK